jgi:GT2 family glycosyltransferase
MSATTSTAPLAYVVLLNTNAWPDTQPCLESLDGLDYGNYRVIVVDNGSTDGSEELIRRHFPDVTVIQTGGNIGFSRGNNAGIRHALEHGAEFVWVLNNDTIVDGHALTALVEEAARHPRSGIIGSALYFADDPGRIQAWGGGTFSRYRGITACSMSPTPAAALDFITGASMFIRREVLEEVGLFDERFFLYMEDTDLCYRARERGWDLAVAEKSVVYHKVGATINRRMRERSADADRVFLRSSGLFLAKHGGRSAFISVPVRLAGMVARRATRRQFGAIPILAREFFDGLAAGLKEHDGVRTSRPTRHDTVAQ